jgi:Flp pilus assembly protein TadB
VSVRIDVSILSQKELSRERERARMRSARIAEERTSKATDRGRNSRVVLMMFLHAGSALIALGIAIAIIGEPDWRWGLLAIALGVMIWLRMFRRIAVEMKTPREKD